MSIMAHPVSLKFSERIITALGNKKVTLIVNYLRHEYTLKRDKQARLQFVRNMPKEFIDNNIVRINPPVAGMFFTIDINAANKNYNGDKIAMEEYVNSKLVEAGVIVAPGSWFEVGSPEEISAIKN